LKSNNQNHEKFYYCYVNNGGGVINSFAQVPTHMFEKNKAFEAHPKFQISRNSAPEKKMPTFDVAPLPEEDKALEGLNIPFRFGKSFYVNLRLKDGEWLKTDSSEIWSLKISSPKAYSLNFIFSELYLPEGAELYVFNEDGSMVYGPVTEKQNLRGRIFLTDIIQGESTTIQIEAPLKTKEEPLLTIQKVIHGYKDLFRSQKVGYGDSGACFDDYNSDVICYPNWNDESDGVVQILLAGGDELCSGSLLNNTAQDYRPFILTAFHCIDIGDPSIINDPDRGNGVLSDDEISQAEEWLVRFRFRHTTCGGGVIANGFTFDDTHFLAAWNTTDFALVELMGAGCLSYRWETVAMDRMTFGVIEPEKDNFHFTMLNISTGEWVSNFTNNDGNPTELCPNTIYQLTTSNNGPFTMYDLEWGLPSGWEIQAQYGWSNHITTYLDVNDNVHTGLSLSIKTECG
jgi:hypothetical protein